MAEFSGFFRDRETGAIIGVSSNSTVEIQEIQNKNLMKEGDNHLIKFDVLGKEEGIKAYQDWVLQNQNKGKKPEPEILETEPELKVRKAGKRPAKV